jgi:sigma-B regulation protein RsbU (phosphoserine phosphatase)
LGGPGDYDFYGNSMKSKKNGLPLLEAEKDRSESLLRRIEQDLAQAAEIQKRLLPAGDPRVEGFEIAGVNVPCYQVGGDYYDFIPIDGDRLGVVIADVSGKGISAALLMASLRAALLAEVQPDLDLPASVRRLNDFVHRSTASHSFITFFLAVVDRRTSEISYVNAGHNPPFVSRRSGGFEALASSGFPLGMFPGADYERGSIRLAEGDFAVLFTDGIPEARDAEGNEFTEDRLRGFVAARRDLPAAGLCREVLGAAQAYSCAAQPCDDITLVVIKRTGSL